MVNPKKIARSAVSYMPIFKHVLKKTGTSPVQGVYYSDIYSSHKKKLSEYGFVFPSKIIAEIGPGDSFGVGMCAILDGFEKYYALDVISHTNISKNLKVLDDIKANYTNKEEIIKILQYDINNPNHLESHIQSHVSWFKKELIIKNSVNLIISNAVLEHIINVSDAYQAMFEWLQPGGYCSHVIDYGAHEFSNTWYKHLYYHDFLWKFLMHGRMYPINRLPHSFHLKEIEKAGFQIIYQSINNNSKADIKKINKNIKSLFNDDDLGISSAFIIAKKPE